MCEREREKERERKREREREREREIRSSCRQTKGERIKTGRAKHDRWQIQAEEHGFDVEE